MVPAVPILITGFEPFVGFVQNPSGLVVLDLLREPPESLCLSGGVLPVSIERVPAAFDRLLAAAPGPPAAVVALGVQRQPWFRLERRARAALRSQKRDNDGRLAEGVRLDGPEELATAFDLEALAQAMRAAGAVDVRISDDAGGFVCERAFHHALVRALERKCGAVFLHVPPIDVQDVAAQRPIVAALLRAVARSL